MSLIHEKQGHIATPGLNRPKRLNALDPGVLQELRMMRMKDEFAREAGIGVPVFGSADAREGVKARKEKRSPDFPVGYSS